MIFAIFPQNIQCWLGRMGDVTVADREAGADFAFSLFTVENTGCK